MSTVKIENMDRAILGCTVNGDCDNVVVYSIEKIVSELMRQNDWDSNTAWDYFDYNIAGAYMGSLTPILVYTDYELFLEE